MIFKWLKNVDGLDAMSISKESKIGFIFEVGLEYPDYMHQTMIILWLQKSL